MLHKHTRYTNKQKKWKQVVYVKGNVSILMVQGVVPKNTNILCTHKRMHVLTLIQNRTAPANIGNRFEFSFAINCFSMRKMFCQSIKQEFRFLDTFPKDGP